MIFMACTLCLQTQTTFLTLTAALPNGPGSNQKSFSTPWCLRSATSVTRPSGPAIAGSMMRILGPARESRTSVSDREAYWRRTEVSSVVGSVEVLGRGCPCGSSGSVPTPWDPIV